MMPGMFDNLIRAARESGKDREERQRTEQLRAEFAAIVESSEDAIISKTLDGRIVSWNPAAERLFGYTAAEAIGQSITFLMPPERVEEERDIIARLVRGQRIEHFETVRRHKNGRNIPVSLSISPVRDDTGRIVRAAKIVRDISERQRADEALRHSRDRLERALEFDEAVMTSMAEGLYTLNSEGLVSYVNPAAERLFGWSKGDLIGRNMHEIIHYKHPDGTPFPAHECAGLAVLKEGKTLKGHEDVFIRKDGTFFNVLFSASPIRSGNRVTGLVIIFRDITQEKQSKQMLKSSEERFKALYNEAEAANRLKDEFLATLSHELRTPLNAIYGWVHMARSGILDEKAIGHALETIDRNARIQSKLIEDLLDISRIITGKIRLDFTQVDLCSIIRAAVETMRLTAENKDIQMDVMLDPESCPFSGDADRLQQALWNLLSNAVKFTPKNGRIEVRIARGESEIDITVSDTGQGIDPTFLPYVFDRFRQADPTPARRHGGLGLGLAIVRYLIELHGGTVHADSDGFGQGSTFTITLPRMASIHPRTPEPSPRDLAAVGSSDESPVSLQDLHILVIEDEPDARFLLLKILEGYGAKVTAVGTVADAMDKLKEFTPDVLVSDIGLPGEDGYSLIRRVRSLPGKERAIHAIALTAHARTEDRAQALSAGYNEHMAKPFDPPSLARVISSRSSE